MLIDDPTQYGLAIKYRPQAFEEVVGNEATIASLKSIIERDQGKLRSSLFIGPSGCGKTTLALILANALGCAESDFRYYNTSNTRGIDTVREIQINCRYKPIGGKIRFYLLDECHELTRQAQDALLGVLEHPPAHVYFALCTTEPNKLLDTIQGRCATFKVSTLSTRHIVGLLRKICTAEEKEKPSTILREIALASMGKVRNAVKTLDQIIDMEDEETIKAAIMSAAVDDKSTLDICRLLVEERSNKWPEMARLVKTMFDVDQEKTRIGILNYMTKVLLDSQKNDRVAKIMQIFSSPNYDTGKIGGLLVQLYAACKL